MEKAGCVPLGSSGSSLGLLSLICKRKGAGPEASKGLPSSDNLWQIWVLLLMIDSGILWWSSG